MELKQLEYFVAVAEERNFTRAAERVHITQSGVGTQIRQLERELGAELIDRSSRAVVFTGGSTEVARVTGISDVQIIFLGGSLSARAGTKSQSLVPNISDSVGVEVDYSAADSTSFFTIRAS